jgi:hypothetical protein
VGDTLLHKRGDYSCCGAAAAGHQQKWTHGWCMTPSTNLAQGGKHLGGGAIILKECE